MNKPVKTMRQISGAAIGLGFAVQLEKMGLGGAIRENLTPPLNYPLIYGSNFLITGIGGFLTGGLADAIARPVKLASNGEAIRKDSRTRKVTAVLGASALIALPTAGLSAFEMHNKCEFYKTADPKLREIQACDSDPIDAALVVAGGILGLGLGLSQKSAELAQRKKQY